VLLFSIMKSEAPQFEHIFTLKDAECVSHIIETHPHVLSVSLFGNLGHMQTASILQLLIEVDDERLFHHFAESFEKEKGDESEAVEKRVIAASYILGDDLLSRIDTSIGDNQHAGNFIDVVIVPPNWREHIDFVQSRLPFGDITVADFVDARELTNRAQ
jgi:hypothetical protein